MNLILCEGSGEIAFIYSYLKTKGYNIKFKKSELYKLSRNKKYMENEIVDNLFLLDIEGNGNLEKIVKKILKSPLEERELIEKVGIFIDAEKDFSETYNRAKKVLEDIKGQLRVEVYLYISPYNNKCDGMLENLIMGISKDKDLLSFIEEKSFPELSYKVEEQGEKIKNPTKAKFMIYGATQNPMNGVAYLFLTEDDTIEKLDFDSEKMENFKKFMNQLVKKM